MPNEIDPKTVHDMQLAIADAIVAMRATADYLVENEHLQAAHYLRHRIGALDKAAAAFTWEHIKSLSQDQLRVAMALDGLDYDEAALRGHELVQRLCAEHKRRSEERRKAVSE